MLNFSKYVRVALLALLSIFALALLPAHEAQAGEYSVNVYLDFVYFSDSPYENDLDDYSYIGPMLRLQPEYAFTDWFSLGVSFGVAGLFYKKDNYTVNEENTNNNENRLIEDGDEIEMLSGYEALATAKFFYNSEHFSAGGMLGLGVYAMPDSRAKQNPNNDNAWFDVNVTAGINYNITSDFGIGIHAGFSILSSLRYAASAGLGIKYDF